MQPQRHLIVQFLVVFTLLSFPSMAFSQSLFTDVVSRTEGLAPLPTEADVAVEKARLIEAQKPKPLIKRDIPQRIEKVTNKTFMVLPREAPLPIGTLSEGFFIEETGEAPPPIQEVKKSVMTPPIDEKIPVLMSKKEGGYEVVNLQQAKKPVVQTKEIKESFQYELDFKAPQSAEKIDTLKSQLKNKNLKYIAFRVTGKTPQMLDAEILWQNRVRALRKTLNIENVRYFILWEERGESQNIHLRAVY